jgi:hypothetical protein
MLVGVRGFPGPKIRTGGILILWLIEFPGMWAVCQKSVYSSLISPSRSRTRRTSSKQAEILSFGNLICPKP